MYRALCKNIDLPTDIISKIYYLSVTPHLCKNLIVENYAAAIGYKNEIDTIYANEDIYPFPDIHIPQGLLIYLTQMLLSDGRKHIRTIDPDTGIKFIMFE